MFAEPPAIRESLTDMSIADVSLEVKTQRQVPDLGHQSVENVLKAH